jgi:hypothetical protein
MEICFLQDGGKIKRQKNVKHHSHSPRALLNIGHSLFLSLEVYDFFMDGTQNRTMKNSREPILANFCQLETL